MDGASFQQLLQHRKGLIRLMRGDLDWIVMKALEKHRRRRYDTASALAQDLERHLHHDPVSAGPPSTLYRLGKFVRRHRVGASVVAAVSAALVVGLGVALVGFAQARRERDRALLAEQRAEEEARVARAVNQFLQEDLLAQADPRNEPDRDLKVRTLLDRAAARIEGRFTNQPLVEASIRGVLGETHTSLGDYPTAEVHLRRSAELLSRELGEQHLQTLGAMRRLGTLLRIQGKYREAETLLRAVLGSVEALRGPESRETLMAKHDLAADYLELGRFEEGEALLQEIVEVARQELGPEDYPGLLTWMANLAQAKSELGHAKSDTGKLEEARGLLLEVLEIDRSLKGPHHPDLLTGLNNLGLVHTRLGQYAEAQRVLREVLEIETRVLGPNHHETLTSMHNLASACAKAQQYEEAQSLSERALAGQRRAVGADHKFTQSAMAQLIIVYLERRQISAAKTLLRELLEIQRRVREPGDGWTEQTLFQLAQACAISGDCDQAESLLEEALPAARARHGDDHPEVLRMLDILALAKAGQGKLLEAKQIEEEVVRKLEERVGREDPGTLIAINGLATILHDLGQDAEAQRLHQAALELDRRILGPAHPNTLTRMANLASIETVLGRYEEAEALHRQVLESRRRVLGANHDNTVETLQSLASLYLDWGRYGDAKQILRQASDSIAEFAPDSPMTLRMRRFLADAYGRIGDWRSSLEQCCALTNSAPAEIRHWYVGAVAALLAEDLPAYQTFAAGLLNRFSATNDPGTGRMIAEIGLLRADSAADLEPVLNLADMAPTGAPEMTAANQLAKGMAEYRRGRWTDAVGWLEEPRRGCRSVFASQAGYFYAMAKHQLNEAEAARTALADADKRFAAVVGCGDLSQNAWHEYGRVVTTRAEAERLIVGKETSSAIDPAALDVLRQKWEPVRSRLSQGDRLARQQKWAEARDAYLEALNHEVFDWDTAETRNRFLSLKLGACLLRAKDTQGHEALCRDLLARLAEFPDAVIAAVYARVCLASPSAPAADLQDRVRSWVAQARAEPDRQALLQGIADYRSGRYPQALESLRATEGSDSLACREAGQVYTVMALHRLDRPAEASGLLAPVRERLAEHLQYLWGDNWWDLALCQVALEEAEQLAQSGETP